MGSVRGQRRIVAAGVALTVVVSGIVSMVLLFHDDGSSEAPVPGDSTTEAASAARLLETEYLPGPGWTATEEVLIPLVDSSEPLIPIPIGNAECAEIQSLETAVYGSEPSFASGTARRFKRLDADGGVSLVSHSRIAFRDEAAVMALMASASAALLGDGLPACIVAVAREQGFVVQVHSGRALSVPPGGVSRVLRYGDRDAAGGVEVVQAVAWWVEQSGLNVLTVSSAGPGFTDDDLDRIVVAAAAVGANPP